MSPCAEMRMRIPAKLYDTFAFVLRTGAGCRARAQCKGEDRFGTLEVWELARSGCENESFEYCLVLHHSE